MFFDLLVSARQAGKRYVISRREACASLRGSLLLEGMIAQAAKFCKPLLDKFGRSRQIKCYPMPLPGKSPCKPSKIRKALCLNMEKCIFKIWKGKMSGMQTIYRKGFLYIENKDGISRKCVENVNESKNKMQDIKTYPA